MDEDKYYLFNCYMSLLTKIQADTLHSCDKWIFYEVGKLILKRADGTKEEYQVKIQELSSILEI